MKMPATAIREEIAKSGQISFERYMELALYCPETGYYEAKKDIVGRAGDFITSVSAGSLFGELLAFQLAEWLAELPAAPEPRALVEAGAHDGKLARDLLTWLKQSRPELFGGIEYVILEPSAARRQWQAETLRPFESRVRWAEDFANLNPAPINGVIFSNELLDAFPVQRFGWDAQARTWFEWGVKRTGERLDWARMPGEPGVACPPELEAVLPDGYIVERSPAGEEWWRQAAGKLARGRLLTIDYGYAAEERFSPARTNGTLRAYHRHHVSSELLVEPGEQDLTAHVDFGALERAGAAAGLATEDFCPQPRFLTRILQKAVRDKCFAPLDAKRVRQFQTLTHPEHMGRAFRALVQKR
jgi:SAM-dependent MidA family methyltransferase